MKVNKLTMQYTQIYSKEILKKNHSESYDMDTIEKTIKNEIEKFFRIDMINIDNVIKENSNLLK
ncbi:hypothetical protein [Clostridium celatum]|uniref:hypothetical protein n=1 Tax=Clostridium celatum TaxID=36834 RepID=UPI002913A295|nr:hypothetical protein [Clostridium celatum]MDU6296184.1 hypothetical protein [Clostridium celatum]MDY3360861.1 hypothetical protein [Clostridium celatum]